MHQAPGHPYKSQRLHNKQQSGAIEHMIVIEKEIARHKTSAKRTCCPQEP